jgi:hypothetical protein
MMEVIWETDELKVMKLSKEPAIYLTDQPELVIRDVIKLSSDELTAFARHWLSLVEEDARQPDWCPLVTEKENVEQVFDSLDSEPKRYLYDERERSKG